MLTNSTIFPVTSHTDHVGPNSTFVAVQGYKEDGVRYIPQAIARGATTIVVQNNAHIPHEVHALINSRGIKLEYVENTRKALAHLSAQAAGYPAHNLKIIGITGTKGKTSTSFILEHILRVAGRKTAILGTVKNSINGIDVSANLTTPQPDYLHQFFKLCVEQGVDCVVMEVAAQAFSLHRVDGIFFDAAVMTNFSREHGEFYQTQEEYFVAKVEILKHLKSNARLLVNADDAWCQRLLSDSRTKGFSIIPHSKNDDLIARCTVSLQGVDHTFSCPALIGPFNCYNVLVATLLALEVGVTPSAIQSGLQSFTGVPGRLERYQLANGALGIIDYAHNPSSFSAVLSTLRGMTKQLIVVFGCGGDRDTSKRPVMGAIAAELADLVVITSDNPRSEDPKDIADAIYAGIKESDHKKVVRELDREKAIKLAYKHATSGSIIALLGKGPDEYQHVGAVKYPFSEKTILKSLI